ncbi:hypothetical protein OAT16_09895 [Prolixibacteraceae bacterium]|nr:hypothetical protein [Prolixibacteraceae bacterium]
MKKLSQTLTLVVLCCYATLGRSSSSIPYFTIKEIASQYYSIPLILSKNHPEVAKRINQTIQMSEVNCLYDVKGKEKFFDNLMDENGYGVTSMEYDILCNNSSILSISFRNETMAAYPDYHTSYLTFNAATGDIIDLPHLFTLEGLESLNDEVSVGFNEVIKSTYLTTINEEGLSREEKKEMEDYVFDLTKCNATQRIWKFGVTESTIVLEKDRCFPHVIQCYDINWTAIVKISDLYDSDLTTLGKKLLEDKSPVRTNLYPLNAAKMSIHGKIDHKYDFTMVLDGYESYLSGKYWYDKNGELIAITVKRVAPNKIEVKESGGSFLFNINYDGTLSGHWTNAKGKPFPIDFN